jgi:hypothetical protein
LSTTFQSAPLPRSVTCAPAERISMRRAAAACAG